MSPRGNAQAQRVDERAVEVDRSYETTEPPRATADDLDELVAAVKRIAIAGDIAVEGDDPPRPVVEMVSAALGDGITRYGEPFCERVAGTLWRHEASRSRIGRLLAASPGGTYR